MKRLLHLAILLLCSAIMQAQTNAITLDELLGRITVDMTEDAYFEEFKKELHQIDSLEKQKYVISEEMTSVFFGGVADLQQKAIEMGTEQNSSSEEQVQEIWVITVNVDNFGQCIAFASFQKEKQGCTLLLLPPNEVQNLQSTYVLKKAKTTLSQYTNGEFIEFMTMDAMTIYSSVGENGMVMILQSVSDSQCLTMLCFEYTPEKLNEEDMKLAAEYMKNGTMPEESAPTAQNQSFEFPSIRNVKWGDSMYEVMQKEGKQDELTEYCLQNGITDRYLFHDRVNGRKCVVTYAFTSEDRAYQLLYNFTEFPKEYCIDVYNQLKNSLKSKYGAPENDKVNKRYEWTKEEWQQVFYGDLSYEASWVTEELVYVEVKLDKLQGRMVCSIHYVYLPLQLLENEKQSSNL